MTANFSFPPNLKGLNIHMVGIKGTGMAALAELVCSEGVRLTGSDRDELFYTDEILKSLTITPLPFSQNNITDGLDCVITSQAYSAADTPDLAMAEKKGLPILRYSQALGLLSKRMYSSGIAGVHGKTTTTGIAGTILKELNLSGSVLAGSRISSFGERCTLINGSRFFIAETCEYRRQFLSFHPQKIVLTGIESDHQDYYPTYEAIFEAFSEYASLLPEGGELIYCADDAGACELAELMSHKREDLILTPYGLKAVGRFRMKFDRIADEKLHFSLPDFFPDVGYALSMPGEHLALNAVAAIALCTSLLEQEGRSVTRSDAETMARGLLKFRGGKRRSEITGEVGNVLFIDDYAHHPSAIKKTLAGYRSFYTGRNILVDFMPHTYSRTQALLEDFAQAFGDADELVLHKIYASAREKAEDYGVSGELLADRARIYHQHVSYYEDYEDARSYLLKKLSQKDPLLFVTMGAGDNWKLGRELYEDLQRQNP